MNALSPLLNSILSASCLTHWSIFLCPRGAVKLLLFLTVMCKTIHTCLRQEYTSIEQTSPFVSKTIYYKLFSLYMIINIALYSVPWDSAKRNGRPYRKRFTSSYIFMSNWLTEYRDCAHNRWQSFCGIQSVCAVFSKTSKNVSFSTDQF